MTDTLTAKETRLRDLTIWIGRNVCDVNGTVTRSEADERARLERETGKQYDWVNRTWKPYRYDD